MSGEFTLPGKNPRVESNPLAASTPLVPPIAEFSYADIGGHQAQFTDLSSSPSGHAIVGWDWDFGDTGAAPPPTANFTFQITGLVVQFTDTSTAVNPKTISSRLWNFGDGTTSTSANPSHTYQAAGSYNVQLTVTDSGSVVSPVRQKTVNLQQQGGLGRIFGLSDFWETTTSPRPNTGMFNGSIAGVTANTIISRINAARQRNHFLVLNMTGGDHSQYITAGKFDINKWKARMATFNTTAIKAAIADAVADNTILGGSMIDEPQHDSWGGGATKGILDQCWTYAHNIFPTMPFGVGDIGDERGWAGTYQHVDFAIFSYKWRLPAGDPGNVDLYRQKVLQVNAADGVQTLFMFNPINGGEKAPLNPAAAGCPLPLTQGNGTSAGNCRMRSDQIHDFGLALSPYGAGLLVWQYDTAVLTKASNITALQAIANDLAGRPFVSLKAIR